MNTTKRAAWLLPLLATLALSCATTTTSSTTWFDPNAPGNWARPGRVESVQEIVRRVEGNPAGGALAGALIGGFRTYGMFVYGGTSPFRPGEPVVLTPQGLARG